MADVEGEVGSEIIDLEDWENSNDAFVPALPSGVAKFFTSNQDSVQESLSSPAQDTSEREKRTEGENKVINVQSNMPMDLAVKGPGKLSNRYLMPDGSVINGKGLGRGRPGIRRGPRKSSGQVGNIKDEDAFTPSTMTGTPSTTSSKRKRTESESPSRDSLSRESTPEYNPQSHSRSGRQIQVPQLINAEKVKATPTPTKVEKPVSLTKQVSTASIRKHPKIRAKVYRGREAFALCEHCLRGNGPQANVIVFCDACNKCWHQRCHEPRITAAIVADTKAEWFCTSCDKILHGKKKQKAFVAQNVTIAPPPNPRNNAVTYGMPLISGDMLTVPQRKKYLESLSREKLIQIIIHATYLAPNMPIYETPSFMLSQVNLFGSSMPQNRQDETLLNKNNVPTQQPTDFLATTNHTNIALQQTKANGEDEDEGFFDDYDELAALYPKPGEGVYDLMLGSESADLGIMLEGPDNVSFSHCVRGQPVPKGAAVY